jgi:mannose-1-phosphate guanylyltransferase/mannose-6-phosphate isomerase
MEVIILAGGVGSRLWPLSTERAPKQFLRFGGGGSLLQKTLRRFSPISDRPVVCTERSLENRVKEEILGHVVAEPVRRNTAPAVLLSVKYLIERLSVSADATVVITPSDHLIDPEEALLAALLEGESFAAQGNYVLFGVEPTRPETGYGYIEQEAGSSRVSRFIEKPTVEIATQLISQGNVLWNSGICVVKIGTFLADLERFAPRLLPRLGYDALLSTFGTLPSISLDKALLEHVPYRVVIPLKARWRDIGSWNN